MNASVSTSEAGSASDDEPPPRGPSVVVSDERAATEPTVDLGDLAELLAHVLRAEGAPEAAEVSLVLVDPERIAELKATHLDGDGGATDVLSFPLDGVAPEAQLIGDVVVCPVVAAEQATSHAGRLADELRLLVVHGALHLAGWDHRDAAEERAMWARERELLTGLGWRPERDPWGAGSPAGSREDR